MPVGSVFDIKRFALHDGPGIRTTVFLKGCPMRCLWCHNPESQRREADLLMRADRCVGCGACVSACPEEAVRIEAGVAVTNRGRCVGCGACVPACPVGAREVLGRTRTVDEVLAEIEKDVLFYDESGGGVTLSGGEPLAQPEFTLALLQACRERGIHTAVDTCGVAPAEVVERVAETADLFLYDVKTLDPARHVELTGVDVTPVLENLRRLVERGCRVWARVPLIPGINDAPDELSRVGEWIASLHGVEAMQILPYHRAGLEKLERLGRSRAMDDVPEATRDDATRAAAIVGGLAGCPVSIGG
jgi:pyruvate formate lyase activating enzyme